jgi:uncharacterized membrane protein HdeD (DUF308 family)
MNEVETLKANWWMLTVRGVALILFGLVAVFWPGLTLVTFVYIFSAFILASGLVGVITSLISIGKKGWFVGLLLSLLELGVGLYLVRHPLASFATIILLLGLSFLVRGVFEIVSALMGDTMATSKALTIISGILGVLVGIMVLNQPAVSGVAFVWLVGLYSLITGPIVIALSLDAKKLATAK